MESVKSHCAQESRTVWIIRTGIGILFCIFGTIKLMGGVQTWTHLGSAMNIFGITFAPMAWGLCASLAEFFGGLGLITNRYTKIAAAFISCVMIIALIMLISQGKEFSAWSYPLSMLIIMLGLIF